MNGAFEVVRVEGVVELDDVDLDELQVKTEVFRAEERFLATEVASERVDGLVQRFACFIVGLVWPQEREDFFARDAGPTGARQQRQNRETSRLRRGTSHHISIRQYADAA